MLGVDGKNNKTKIIDSLRNQIESFEKSLKNNHTEKERERGKSVLQGLKDSLAEWLEKK